MKDVKEKAKQLLNGFYKTNKLAKCIKLAKHLATVHCDAMLSFTPMYIGGKLNPEWSFWVYVKLEIENVKI